VILGEFDPLALVGLVGKYRITHVNVVPAVILFLLQQPEVKNADFSSLKVMMYGAAPMAQDLLRQARETFGCDFAQVYGMTETTGVGTCLMPEDHIKRPEKLKSVGRPSSGIEMKIITPEGKPAKPGEVGEVMIRGACVMKGYWNKPEATAETVVDGWLRTGDAAYMDEEGYLYIHDRVKEMIISGGENIYPAEVENAIFAHPKVADVAIIGIPDDRWGEAVKAVVVVQPGEKLTAQEVIDFARDRIAHYKCPKSVDFIDALPRNPSGKILRRELRKPYWVGRERMVS
jgi:acyl-CoA synthetase (AMP-forming)/AMP-acid ligase II